MGHVTEEEKYVWVILKEFMIGSSRKAGNAYCDSLKGSVFRDFYL